MNTRKLLLSFIFVFICVVANAQILVGPQGYGKQENRFSANLFFRPPVVDDTTCNLVESPANGDCYGSIVVLRSDNKLYMRDSMAWSRVGGGIDGIVVDSARRSNDTLYFRRNDGGEIAVRMQGILIDGVNGLQDSLSNKPTFAQANDMFIRNNLASAQTANFWINGTGIANVVRGNTRLDAGQDWQLIGNSGSFSVYYPSGSRTPLSIASGGLSTFTGGISLSGGNFSFNLNGGGSPNYMLLTNFTNATHIGSTSDELLTWNATDSRVKRVPYPTSLPTSSGLSTVLANGNTANSNITLGGAGVPINFSYRLGRTISAVDYTAFFDIGGSAGLPGARIASSSTGSDRSIVIPPLGTTAYFSPDGNVSNYQIWHENNHPAGVTSSITYTGAEVPASFSFNSAGHYTASGKRTLTAGDIGAVNRSAPDVINWNSFNGTTVATFNFNNTNAPTVSTYYSGLNMPGSDGTIAAQIAFRNNAGYFRTLEAGTYGSWLQFADRTWVTSNFAAGSGSGNYIQNQNVSAQSSANFFISGSGEMNGALNTNVGNAGTHIRMNSIGRSLRFGLGLTGSETGSNAGSDFTIWRYTDAGAFIGSAFSIARSTGAVTIPGTVTISGKTLMPNNSGISGTGTGSANNAVIAFYESNGTTRQGYIGKGSPSNNTIYLTADIGNLEQTAVGDINLNAIGGVVGLTNTTKNHLVFGAIGTGAPTFTTRSVGTKVALWPTVNATNVDYSIGVEASNVWMSVPQNTGTHGFKWYGGTTEVARLSGTGQLNIASTLTVGNIPAQGSAASHYLTSLAGVIQYRTAAQVRSDIGAQAAGSYVNLQAATPGTAQTGHINITGTGIIPVVHSAVITSEPSEDLLILANGAPTGAQVTFTTQGVGIGGVPGGVHSERLLVGGNAVTTDAWIVDGGGVIGEFFLDGGLGAGVRTTTNHPLKLYSNNIERINLNTSGQVEFKGGIINKTVSSTSTAYAVTATDHVIKLDPAGTGGSGTITLPNPATSEGRELKIIAVDGAIYTSNYDILRPTSLGPPTTSIQGVFVIQVVGGEWVMISKI